METQGKTFQSFGSDVSTYSNETVGVFIFLCMRIIYSLSTPYLTSIALAMYFRSMRDLNWITDKTLLQAATDFACLI